PELIIANRSVKLEIGGTSTVTIEEGAHYVNMVYRDDILTKIHVRDFCKTWVEPSGGHCPVEPGKFYFEWNLLASSIPQIDPINMNITELNRIT
ncbi:17235_t:CDS:1, partial [Gigaspora rosea]